MLVDRLFLSYFIVKSIFFGESLIYIYNRQCSAMTELCLRGPWIAGSYYKDERTEESMKDGWLHTGDIVTVDSEGFIKIVDHTKDLIKSGGEWISSVDLENALISRDKVLEAEFPKWWMPDDILFVNEIPKTVVGKFLKRALRDQLKTYMVEKK